MLAWLIAAFSAAAFVTLWFWEARRILKSRMSTVESAAAQLSVCCRSAENGGARESAEILVRSESIYRQAAELYNRTYSKPWIRLPGWLLGYRKLSEPLPHAAL